MISKMKPVNYLVAALLSLGIISCGGGNYKKTKTGLLYKIIPSGSKDSLAKPGNYLKLHFMQTRNGDTVLYSTYGKMPVYQQVTDPANMRYNPSELFPLIKKGDSVVAVLMVDSLVRMNPAAGLPPHLKKSDRLYLHFKVLEVFTNDSLYNADYAAEMQVYAPIMEKEREEEMARMKKQLMERKFRDYDSLEQSGEAGKQRKVVEDYLAAKNISAKKTGRGTYVQMLREGDGPQIDSGKYVTIKYSVRRLANDSTFESSTYPDLQVGQGNVIEGWEEGLMVFKQGGKGVLFVPGFLAYGKTPREGGPVKPNDALIFDIEVLKVADKPEQQPGH